MPHFAWRHGLLFRTALFMLAAFVMAGLSAILISTSVTRDHAYRAAHERLDQLLDTVESTARVACFAQDAQLATEVTDGLLKNPVVARVSLEAIAADRPLPMRLAGTPMTAEASRFNIERPLHSPFDPARVIGHMHLQGNAAIIEQDIHAEIRFAIMQTLGQLVIIGLALGAVILIYIVRPIQSMSDGLHHMDPTRGERLVCPAHHGETEIGRLTEDINGLASDLVAVLDAERTLREEYRSIFENAETGIFIIGADGQLTSWNPWFAHLMGISHAEEHAGPLFQSRLPWSSPERFTELSDRCRRDEIGLSSQFAILPQAGVQRWVNVLLTPIGGNLVQGVVHDITEHMEAEDQARRMAITDSLTGTMNRPGFEAALREMTESGTGPSGGGFALLLVDLDNFKRINEGYGLPAGDALLKAFTARLRKEIKAGDHLARLGADRFGLLLPAVGPADRPQEIAERLLEVVRPGFRIDDVRIETHASAGIALFPGDGQTSADLLRYAELALDLAKAGGGNRCVLYDSTLGEAAEARQRSENDLRAAIERGQLVVHYQPIIDLDDMRMAGAEALLRWNHPERGLVAPGEFIPLAEEIGLIDAVGLWVLETACAQLATWQENGQRYTLSVNVSGKQIPDGLPIEHIEACVSGYGIDAARLALEITEGVLMENLDAALSWLEAVHAIGCRIYLDDFGTGYSSLSYLKRFPVDTLKVDRSFVRDMHGDDSDRALVETIIAMARSLRMDVVAEGVENALQLESLHGMGCRYAQGYFFAPPLAIDELDARFTETAGPSRPTLPTPDATPA